MLDRYLADLARQLPLAPAAREDILREVRSHLEEAAGALRAAGLGETESEVKAMERFGDAAAIGRELREVHSGGTWGEALLAALVWVFLPGDVAIAIGNLLAAHFGLKARTAAEAMAPAEITFMIMTIVICVVITLGWRRGKPIWFYPWLGLVPLRAPAVLYKAVELLDQKILGQIPGEVLFAMIIVVMLLFSVAVAALAARRDWRIVSFTLFPVSVSLALNGPMMISLSPSPYRWAIQGGVLLLAAVATAFFVLTPSPAMRLACLAGPVVFCCVAGVIVAVGMYISPYPVPLNVSVAVTMSFLGLFILLAPAMLAEAGGIVQRWRNA